MLKFMSKMDQMVTSLVTSYIAWECGCAYLYKQIANTLNRKEEGKLPSQLVANLKGHYMVETSTSYHQQVLAITTL
jgi:hypothetical protein